MILGGLDAEAVIRGPGLNAGMSVLSAITKQLILTQVAADNFNRANGPIAGANNWAAISTGGMSIQSNELIGQASTQLGNIRSGETYTGNQYSQCQVGSVALVTNGYIGPSVRNQDSANGYVLIYFNSGGTIPELILYKKVAGAYTALYTLTLAGALAQGTLLSLIAEGNVLQVSAGGVAQFAILDSTFASGGTPGVESDGVNSLDNWSGGNAATMAVGAALATDNFNRADGNVSAGNPNWALMNYPFGTSTVEVPIVSLQCSAQNPPVLAHAGDVRVDSGWGNDQWSALQMGTTAENATGFVGVTTRNQGSGGTLGKSGYLGANFQAAGTPPSSQAYRIYRLDNGASTLLASTFQSAAGNDPPGTGYKLVSQGSRHSLRLVTPSAESEILAVTDATYNGGPPGIMMFGNATADNWSGGNV